MPSQRRRADPRDLEDEKNLWNWKQYLLAGGLGAVGILAAGFTIVGIIRRRG